MKRNNLFLQMSVLLVLLLLYLSGCNPLWAVPFTLKEIKDYVAGQERSFAYPLNRVIIAGVYVLQKDGFTVYRIEHFNQKGLVNATWQDTSVEIILDTVTPKMTRITSRVHSNKLSREYSCEGAVFDEVQRMLERRRPLDWKEVTVGMVTVHVSPERGSPVIAYLREGVKIQVVEERGEWGKIALMDRSVGFVALKQLHLASEQNAH